MANMLGRMAGAAIGAMFSSERRQDPIKGALIGAATMFVARKVLPARIAGIAATVAAGYVAKKLADRELAKQNAATSAPRKRRKAAKPVANGETEPRPAEPAPTAAPAPVADRATDRADDRTVPPTTRSTKLPQPQRDNASA